MLRSTLRWCFCEHEVDIPKWELVKLYKIRKWSLQKIAFHYNSSKASVCMFMYYYGIPRRNQRSKYKSLKHEFKSILESGITAEDIAKRYGVSVEKVTVLFNDLRIR